MNQKNTPKVAIVIVNWNKKDYIVKLLQSLQNISYDNHEIIVVDNASTDGSVEAIKRRFPEVTLLVNKENLGGTGGFNTGMRYALLEKTDCKYIWLLDNDAEVDRDTLKELVDVMENDTQIGIVGSRILDPLNRKITVEAGAFVRRDIIGVIPLYRNVNVNFEKKIIEVDYVAICSALIRVSALKKVGLMDERFFIFWDDMEWGLRFKKKGYKVVCALNSIVFHPPFTEKRNPVMDFYYGIRNALITYSKHTGPIKRLLIFYRYMRTLTKTMIFLGCYGRADLMRMTIQSLIDFIIGDLGGRVFSFNNKLHYRNTRIDFSKAKKVLILNTGFRDDIFGLLENLQNQKFPSQDIILLINDDRKEFFKDKNIQIIVLKSKMTHKITYSLKVFMKILKENFDIAISPAVPSPFTFTAKRSYLYTKNSNSFFYIGSRIQNIIKLIAIVVSGEILSILLFLIIYSVSFKYSNK